MPNLLGFLNHQDPSEQTPSTPTTAATYHPSLPNLTPQLAGIFSLLKEAVFVVNQSSQIVIMNKQAEDLTGYSFSEAINRPFEEIVTINTLTNHKLLLSNFCGATPFILNEEAIIHGKADKQAKVNIKSTPFSDNGLLNKSYILMFSDVGKQKALEEMQIDFVSMASHELRTPLTSVINYLAVLDEEIKASLDDEHKQFLERSLASAKQLLSLVNNMLDVSHIERGAATVAISQVDWTKNLNQIVADNKPLAVQKNISLELTPITGDLPPVLADPVRINEVLNNLISNALKHNKSGGWVKLSASVQGDQMVTSVSDNGEGMPKEALPHLFTKFYRVPGSLDKMKEGTGLGLYLAKSIVDMHKGRIWVESELGKGSTFYFSIPIATQTSTIANLHLPTA